MTLSDTALVMLAAAAQRADCGIEVPARLKGAAAMRLTEKLQGEGLIETVWARGSLPVWRRDEDNRAIALRITKAGLKAIRVEEAEAGTDEESLPARASRQDRTQPPSSQPSGRERAGSKQAQVIAMLRRPEGTTVAAIMEATRWQPHSVRGFLAGAVRKRLGLTLVSEVVEGMRLYRIVNKEVERGTSRRAAA